MPTEPEDKLCAFHAATGKNPVGLIRPGGKQDPEKRPRPDPASTAYIFPELVWQDDEHPLK